MYLMPISDHTRKALWGLSGGVCARCRNSLIEDATELEREALVGEEAHIVSKAQSGPRHGPEPAGGYDGLDNLVLLCRVCHAVVDAQPASYPGEALRAVRDAHTEWIKTRTRSDHVLPQLRFSPIPQDLELKLVASGRQLVDLVSGADDATYAHDQPRDAADATLMSDFLKRVDEANMEIDAIGAHHAIELSQEFQEILLGELLPLGIIVLGARAERTVSAAERTLPWTTCVLSIRYAPQSSQPHGARADPAGAVSADDLPSRLSELLAEGLALRSTARISDNGACAVIEVWEEDVRRALARGERPDLTTRFDQPDRLDAAKLVSAPWATKRRFARELAMVAEFVGDFRGARPKD